MDKISRKNPDPKQQLLFYSQQPIGNDIYAIVRVTWFGKDGCCAVTESRVNLYDIDVVMEFTDIVGNALRTGADVSVICIDDPENLGIQEV
jgi:hypothetical protein